jgi:hypothetical protein
MEKYKVSEELKMGDCQALITGRVPWSYKALGTEGLNTQGPRGATLGLRVENPRLTSCC